MEDAAIPFPTKGKLVGHAYGVTASTNSYTGTLNAAESGDIVDVDVIGHKWVWDFATDRAMALSTA